MWDLIKNYQAYKVAEKYDSLTEKKNQPIETNLEMAEKIAKKKKS